MQCISSFKEHRRDIYRYSSGDRFSNILVAKAEIDAHIETKREEYETKIETARERRKALIEACQGAGLKVVEKNSPEALDDIESKDAEGRLIECSLIVEVESTEKAQTAIRFCHEKNLMALPIGGRTSGLGVFEAMGIASQKGFEGVLGIQLRGFMDYREKDEREEVSTSQLIEVPAFEAADYDLIQHKTLPLALLKSKSFPGHQNKPHRVIAHAGCTVQIVNDFLKEKLQDDRYAYRIVNDLTTRKEAQLGGVISTGAEGGNRSKPSEDILSTTIVNGQGEKVILDKEESKKIVGLNGATLVTQVEFEVTAMPKHEHALFIPIKGTGVDMWKNMLRLQQKLKKYCRAHNGNRRILEGEGENGLIITGMEPLSKGAIDIALENGDERDREHYTKILKNAEAGVYVTFSAFTPEGTNELEEIEKLLTGEFARDLGIPKKEEDLEVNEVSENFQTSEQPTHNEVKILTGAQRHRMDEIRHGAPSHSKEKATKLGGQTMSTDLNIRFVSDDPEENERAIAAVAEIYNNYAGSFTPEEGFRVVIYGHLHPGLTEQGGGFDPHIRVIFELSNPHSRYDAPEKVIAMKKRQIRLYQKLLALDSQHGIEIRCPEKSRFTNQEYWKWLCLSQPEEARSYLEAVAALGYSRNDDGQLDRAILGARVPHELPGTVRRVPGGIKAIMNEDLIETQPVGDERIAGLDPILRNYWKAILEISQLSHRSGTIKRMLGEVQREIHEQFGLSDEQYAFFIESPKEAKAIVERNFGQNYASQGYRIITVTLNNIEETQKKFPHDEKIFYAVNLEGLGIPRGLSLLIAPHASIREAYERTLDGRNTAAFRNLYTLWEKWPYETEETPNLAAIASLGIILQKDQLPNQKAKKRPHRLVTTNPGPSQIHEAVMDGVPALFESLDDQLDPERQKEIIGELKDYLGIPKNHPTAFCVSATQCMQLLADAIAPQKGHVKVLQVTNDAFSERWHAVSRGRGIDVERIQTPWTTSEHSEIERVAKSIADGMDPKRKNLVMVTPHKTSTAADFTPDRLIAALQARGKIIGKDYHLICDVTSGIGARDYATYLEPDSGFNRIPFGMFGSFQKGMGQPPGIAFLSLPPQITEYLGLNGSTRNEDFSLAQKFKESDHGNVVNPMGLAMLGQKVDAERMAGRRPEAVQEETHRKAYLVLGWLERHPDLMVLTPNALDSSPLLFCIFSQAKNLVVAKRILADIFGYYVGGGYGPFEKEAIRLYLPNIAYDDLKNLLAALDHVLTLDDVVKTRGEQIPNIALREPHNPLTVIERLMNDFQVDDIFEDTSGLHWLERLFKTWNANQTKNETQVGNDTFNGNGGDYTTKAHIYGYDDNLAEMEKIVLLKDDHEKSIVDHYLDYLRIEKEIRCKITGNPEAKYMENINFTREMDLLIQQAKGCLMAIAHLLREYVQNQAAHDTQGRVAWALVA